MTVVTRNIVCNLQQISSRDKVQVNSESMVVMCNSSFRYLRKLITKISQSEFIFLV